MVAFSTARHPLGEGGQEGPEDLFEGESPPQADPALAPLTAGSKRPLGEDLQSSPVLGLPLG